MWPTTQRPLYYGGVSGEGEYGFPVAFPFTTTPDNTYIKETGWCKQYSNTLWTKENKRTFRLNSFVLSKEIHSNKVVHNNIIT